VSKGATGIGGASGRSAVHECGAFVGCCDLSQGSIGFRLGGQASTEIICFATSEALVVFDGGRFDLDAQATAMALDSGSGANASHSNGVAVFPTDERGLMYEASIGGQKFSYQAREPRMGPADTGGSGG
jgi:lipid-binding SYLF domain-containing protein